MRILGHPVLIGGEHHGRSHPGILTSPQPPMYRIVTMDPDTEMQTYTKRLGMIGRGTLLVYYAEEALSDEDAWERLMEIVIDQVGFEEITP